MNEKKQRNQEKGITLIALVITVIVLLILAGITIQALTGENGILRRTAEAKERTEIAQIKENAKIDILGVKAGNNGEITLKQLKGVLKKYCDANEVNALTEDNLGTVELTTIDGKYAIKVSEIIDKVTNVPLDWDAILADATANPENYKHPDQSSTNGDIGIGTDGEPVNLDLWTYSIWNNEASLTSDLASSGIPAYENENIDIETGEIQGKVPQYIKKVGTDNFAVVTNMGYTFYGCTNLKKAPEIPSSVTSMYNTFEGCTKLTGDLIINAKNLSVYTRCLTNASTAPGTDLKLSGSCPQLNEILATKSDNSNISLK